MAELYTRSRATEFGLSAKQFVEVLEGVAAKHLQNAGATEPKRQEFFASLRVEDLALARACAAGNERAWEVFMQRFREKLYDVAAFITKETSSARELADSVYAELYGTGNREGGRVSKLASYSGRGSLEGWLRTVLAQEFVNRYRKQRRLISLDEEAEAGAQFAAATVETAVPADSRLVSATDQVLRSLDSEERFVLASYFLDERTLAQIAKALSVHESTISRKVEKLTKVIRKQILKNLIGQGMSRRQADEALAADVRDLALDIRASLTQDSAENAFLEKQAKSSEGGT